VLDYSFFNCRYFDPFRITFAMKVSSSLMSRRSLDVFCFPKVIRSGKYWDTDFKATHIFYHLAKFHSDRPKKLEDCALKRERKRHEA